MPLSFLTFFCFISQHLFSAYTTGLGSRLCGKPSKQITKPHNGTLNSACYTCFEEMLKSFKNMRFCQYFQLPFCFISPHLSNANATGKGSSLRGSPTKQIAKTLSNTLNFACYTCWEELFSSLKDMRACWCFLLPLGMISDTVSIIRGYLRIYTECGKHGFQCFYVNVFITF